MKILWAVIALLLLTSGYLALRRPAGGGAVPTGTAAESRNTALSVPASALKQPSVKASAPTGGPGPMRVDVPAGSGESATAAPAAKTEEREVQPIAAPAPGPEKPAGDPLEELAAQAIKGVPDRDAVHAAHAGSTAGQSGAGGTGPERANPASAPTGEGAEGASDANGPAAERLPLPGHGDFSADKMVPARTVEKSESGALRIDGRFVVKGAGSKEQPFAPSWDLLISAQEVYKPRSGLKKLPERVTFLHEQQVRITGFVAFPITSNNPKECLVMLNQWDGCCIGVPPTAFDAIEVRLSKAATDTQRLAVHGVLEGRLRVDPYEDGGWVLGLYMMEDATFTPD
ncbi:MAG: hypothetical protein ACT4PL_03390 [Phycisphaerales bacterium]